MDEFFRRYVRLLNTTDRVYRETSTLRTVRREVKTELDTFRRIERNAYAVNGGDSGGG